jgi:hypothetical protein
LDAALSVIAELHIHYLVFQQEEQQSYVILQKDGGLQGADMDLGAFN